MIITIILIKWACTTSLYQNSESRLIKGAAGRLDKKPPQLPYVSSSKNAGKMAAAVVERTRGATICENMMGI